MLKYFAEVAILHLLVSPVVAHLVLGRYLGHLEESEKTRLVTLSHLGNPVVVQFLAASHFSACPKGSEIVSLANLVHLANVVLQCFGAVGQYFGVLAKHENVHLEVNWHLVVVNGHQLEDHL